MVLALKGRESLVGELSGPLEEGCFPAQKAAVKTGIYSHKLEFF
ncbi:hypothetical protein [Candidimonas humi]|jgi:hypothetical protein